MNLIPSNIGAEPKKIAALGAAVVLLVVVYLWNRTPSAPDSAPAPVAVATPVPAPIAPMPSTTAAFVRAANRQGSRAPEEFRPSLKLKDGVDVTRIDPTLKLELLARLRKVPLETGSRSLFEIGAPPPPKALLASVKPIIPGALAPGRKPGDPPPAPPKPAGPPPPPPIPLKFYGFVNNPHGPKRAFFLDGEDIFMAGENELVHNRYRIIRIGVNSAVVEGRYRTKPANAAAGGRAGVLIETDDSVARRSCRIARTGSADSLSCWCFCLRARSH